LPVKILLGGCGVGDYKKLEVWKKAHALTIDIYKLSNKFSSEERYGMVSQIRRAAASIPMNIAEGSGSLYEKEFIRFLGIARRSACEVEYQIILCKDLEYVNEIEYTQLSSELKTVSKMLNGLIKNLVEKQNKNKV
jgi:four helix bundle protein